MKSMIVQLSVLLLALLMTLSLAACQTPDNQNPDIEAPGGSDDKDNGNEKKDPATDGVFDINDFDPKKEYELVDYASLTITDYITLGRYKNLTLTIAEENITISDEMLNNRIETILFENHPDAKVKDRAIAWNDTVVVDYVGKKDGVAFDNGSASDVTVEVKEKNNYIPGFVEGLVGLVPGQTADVPMKFPDDYHAKDLAGQEVVFTFTVHYIIGHPELTDDFVTEYTEGEFTTAQAYKDDMKADMEQQAYDATVRMAFWRKITENAAVKKYPEDAVMYYYSYYYGMYSYYATQSGVPLELYLLYYNISLDSLFNACCGAVKEEMVYYAIFAAEGYEYTEEQYQRALELYTETNIEQLNEFMTSSGKDAYTYEEAKAYFDKEEHDLLVLQTLEEIAYNDLIEGYTIVIEPAKEDDNKTESGESEGK
jgi:trigger factor